MNEESPCIQGQTAGETPDGVNRWKVPQKDTADGRESQAKVQWCVKSFTVGIEKYRTGKPQPDARLTGRL